MPDQSQAWSNVAGRYDELFVDPYHREGSNPLLPALARLPDKKLQIAGDFGCGTGVFLPYLAKQIRHVVAVDFAPGMLKEAQARCRSCSNISFFPIAFDQLHHIPKEIDVGVSINSLVNSDVALLDQALRGMRNCLRPHGRLYGIVPSLEGLHYHVMLLIDLGINRGLTLDAAYRFAAQKAELQGYDFNTATFTFDKIKQHLWLREEVGYRLRKAGFRRFQIRKAHLPWHQFAEGRTFAKYQKSWDWAFVALKT
jgi:SAM-dependent methyltransferase